MESLFKSLIDRISIYLDRFTNDLGQIKQLILDHFGQNGLIAAYIVLAVLVMLIVSRMVKISFATLKYLIIPAIGLAVLGSFLLPYSFFLLLPVTATGCSLVLLFKG